MISSIRDTFRASTYVRQLRAGSLTAPGDPSGATVSHGRGHPLAAGSTPLAGGSAKAADLDLLAPRNDDVGDHRRRKQAVLDDADGRRESRG